jgi:hypothetical protein
MVMGNRIPIDRPNGRIRCLGFSRQGLLGFALLVFCLCPWLRARTHETGAPSFSIDLDQSYAEVVKAVEDVARSSVIKGTFEYRGEDQLGGAQFEDASRLFPEWSQPGKIFYKVRSKALSPAHFLNSNDVGTVAVRYVVQEIGSSTRLFIDAVFIENAGHHNHPSDGYVETCEFAEIGKRLKNLDELRMARSSGQEFSPGSESSSRPGADDASYDPHRGDLEKVIAEQRAQLAADTANLEKLEAQMRQMRTSEFARVTVERAEMKAQPYAHARSLAALKMGQEVTILAKSTYWYRVRSEDGQEGWISHKDLEAQP